MLQVVIPTAMKNLFLWADTSDIYVASSAELKRKDNASDLDAHDYGAFERVTTDPLEIGVPGSVSIDGHTDWIKITKPLAEWISDEMFGTGGKPGFFGVTGQIPDEDGELYL